MLTKLRMMRLAKRQTQNFLRAFHAERQPLKLYQENIRFERAPAFHVYAAGCRELTFHTGAELSEKINAAQLRAVSAAMERAVGESALGLESQLILLSTAVAGAPFLGLLGTVWGVMDTFAGVAVAGKPNLAAMAPGVSGALVTTIFGLLVAIPAMFGYNFILSNLRALIVETENFAAEFLCELEHRYVKDYASLF